MFSLYIFNLVNILRTHYFLCPNHIRYDGTRFDRLLFLLNSSLSEFITKLKDGQLKFEEIEKILGQQFKQDYKIMEAEMRILDIPETVIRQRIKQLKQTREFGNCVRGAQTMLKFKEIFNLTGYFRPVINIASVF